MSSTENIRVIAEFIGDNYEDALEDNYWGNGSYATSWDRLMPVVEKIEDLGTTIIFERPLKSKFVIVRGGVKVEWVKDGNYKKSFWLEYTFSGKGYEHSMYSHRVIKKFDYKNRTLIEAVYEAALEFINWYNENIK